MQGRTFVKHQHYSHLADEEIVAEILKGNKSLFEVIMRRYNQRLFRIQRGYVDDESSVQDTL